MSADDVFAAGDTIAFAGRELPKSGVYAVRAGPVLADNIRRALTGRPLRRFRPQREALYLVSTGERHAVGTRNGLVVEGAWVWRWKDWIDRRFMRKFNELPAMRRLPAALPPAGRPCRRSRKFPPSPCAAAAAAPRSAPPCSRARLPRSSRPRAPTWSSASTRPTMPRSSMSAANKLSLQTVDYFRAIVDDPYMLGKIAANHALGDVYAMGGEPQTALAIATVPYGLETKVEADLSAMMAGANEVLRDAGCALVGGHTSEGAELALGFAINGLVPRGGSVAQGRTSARRCADPDQADRHRYVARRRHARQGQGPLGDGGDRPHESRRTRKAADILRRHGVHAATDVTGFGLIGHLIEMVRASDVDVTVAIDRVPLLDGARETVSLGIFSSLQPQNVRLRRAISELAPLPGIRSTRCCSTRRRRAVCWRRFRSARRSVASPRCAPGYARADTIGFVSERNAELDPVTLDLGGAGRRGARQAASG